MLGASSRAAIHLMSAAKANARLEGRDTVTNDDVREMAPYVLRHRLICKDAALTPEAALEIALNDPILTEADERPGAAALPARTLGPSARAPPRAHAARSPVRDARGTPTIPA